MLGSQGNIRKLYFSRSSAVSPRVAPSDGAEWNAFSHSRQTVSSPLISMPQTPQCLPCCSVCMLSNSSNRLNLAMGPYRVITIILCCCSLPSETLFLGVSLLGIPASFMKMARRLPSVAGRLQYREERDPFLFVLLPVPSDSYRTPRRASLPGQTLALAPPFVILNTSWP